MSLRTDAAMDPGARVFIDGLVSRSDLKGMRAELLSFDTVAGRWAVTLENKESIKVKPANLKLPDAKVSKLGDEIWEAAKHGNLTKLAQLLQRASPMGWGNACRSDFDMTTLDVA